jgi:hypothetical protein
MDQSVDAALGQYCPLYEKRKEEQQQFYKEDTSQNLLLSFHFFTLSLLITWKRATATPS